MERTVYHVVPHDEGSGRVWKVEKEGADRPTRIFLNKNEAVQFGMDIASRDNNGQLKIHNVDGRFEEERTYGNDPERYPG